MNRAQRDKRPSQKERILCYLRAGNRITPISALEIFGSLRLGARIWDLRQEGHDIQDRLIETDGGKMVSEYWLLRRERLTHQKQTALQF